MSVSNMAKLALFVSMVSYIIGAIITCDKFILLSAEVYFVGLLVVFALSRDKETK